MSSGLLKPTQKASCCTRLRCTQELHSQFVYIGLSTAIRSAAAYAADGGTNPGRNGPLPTFSQVQIRLTCFPKAGNHASRSIFIGRMLGDRRSSICVNSVAVPSLVLNHRVPRTAHARAASKIIPSGSVGKISIRRFFNFLRAASSRDAQ